MTYANQRIQFGKLIREYQLVKGLVAEMATQIEAARLLVCRAAWLSDQDRPFSRGERPKALKRLNMTLPVAFHQQEGGQCSSA